MAKRQRTDKAGFTDTGLPTPQQAVERTAAATGKPANEYLAAAEKGKELLSRKKRQPEYRSDIGRRRYNTMMHPDLIELLATIAKGKGITTPDLIEELICNQIGIEPPSKL